jgi:MSHA pilin protein MshD
MRTVANQSTSVGRALARHVDLKVDLPILRNTNPRGFTLVELVVVIVVLALALTGVTLVINRAVIQSPEALLQTRAMELAQTYLDEILSKRFDEHSGSGGLPRCNSIDSGALACTPSIPTADPGEATRLAYDDVDDYDGLNEQPPISLTSGTASTLYDDYRVQVSVVHAGSELGLANNQLAKRITVTVTTPQATSIPVSAYRVNY